jgi:3-deoxy-manno-octulosonate cytidylyltransferase (CMP-KDO synthetase)
VSFTVLIPARLASTRLPRKPLADIAGRPMVVRVAERACASAARRVIVVADDGEIVDACRSCGVEALLTRSDHASGSDRLAEACTTLGLNADEVVVNVQGDEPLIESALIDACAQLLSSQPDCAVGTAAHPIDDAADLRNPNIVKVVTDSASRALYFSRAPIPWWRDGYADGISSVALPRPLRHIGIYAYRAGYLRRFPTLPPAPLEQLESLEQLRVLWHGDRIAVHVSAMPPAPGVDTADDLHKVRALFASR